MNHLAFTLAAYFFNALSILANKFLLKSTIPNPLIYTFYISFISLIALFALPFTKIPSLEVFILASLSTLLWTFGAYFMFKALKAGQVSRVIPIIGTIVPMILLTFASGTNALTNTQTAAIAILIAGVFFLTSSNWKGKIIKREITFEFLAAAGFASSYIILRQAYQSLDFLSVLAWSRLILLPFCLFVIAIPSLRTKIITSHGLKIDFFSQIGFIFLGGQAAGIFSELLIRYSITLANPALVNSLQGTQYIILFVFGIILSKKYPDIFKEKYTFAVLISKLIGIILIGTGLFLLAFSRI
ncbi:MAG: hypothetical protein ACD_38C00032G0002 [uncultured bacterium]|uniref:EamA domain-containing protein n=1 Tax=Candidatus Daviesbacteria bacterium GW2011_GWC2_40_12 TaxID=1618431 RepID=A0A0G0QNU0_9BACT|nr:MAG: hypothetical protein ACD_38C00032G0002 [uncultured bacterium]KKQ84844.1 MAG: hypothetical protein UT04_C0011G0018 [Candidatus Daviesbacteria bacterium GW2011_GWF2_38_7]KKR16523.1 MAG: hypothetical protein UT45_C0005G0052 [Candidatus Daviesbacteria bacterium GW2011_GWA2_39_33]KKR24518.1 MAG: hypothetical protein UT54_C0018G0018 [Candidatus Daviesbacteria bacterium GW2011_GWB1_39_5]KKR41788.1 MAG: hypothetical protein UT77_C0006G0020 [Candidatus Daviesbacteria bacterium GW2011_GWC2_40_12]